MTSRPSTRLAASLAAALLVALVAPACKPSGSSGGGSGNSNGSGQPALARGPFVAEVTTTSLTIAWSTDIAGTGEVEYGPDLSYGSLAAEGTASKAHAVSITGLSPGTAYRYLVRTSGRTLASAGSFATARPASDPHLRFVAFGDSGSGNANQMAVAARALDAAPDLVIHTGDVIYEAGETKNFDPRFFRPYAALLDHVPIYTSLGNHDVLTANGQPYLDAFHLPHNNPQDTERYYSFEAANAHFIALDSNESLAPGSPMRDWLIADLGTAADWKFVFFHHPPFSSALHTSDLTIRAELEPLLAAGGVDVVFNGHDHAYERTFPLASSAPVDQAQEPHYMSPGGVVYVVTGGGGRSLYARTQFNAFTAVFQSVYHLVRVDLSGRSLTLTAIRSDGAAIDSMTIDK
jgi:hypothetical protein